MVIKLYCDRNKIIIVITGHVTLLQAARTAAVYGEAACFPNTGTATSLASFLPMLFTWTRGAARPAYYVCCSAT
jgi:hypothetical protein